MQSCGRLRGRCGVQTIPEQWESDQGVAWSCGGRSMVARMDERCQLQVLQGEEGGLRLRYEDASRFARRWK